MLGQTEPTSRMYKHRRWLCRVSEAGVKPVSDTYMEKLGVRQKCGKVKMVRDHHAKGYQLENRDSVVPYCRSCDRQAHKKARSEGRCILSSNETHKLSSKSYIRRSKKQKHFFTTIAPNIQLRERVTVNKNTGTISVSSGFHAEHGYKLKIIWEK